MNYREVCTACEFVLEIITLVLLGAGLRPLVDFRYDGFNSKGNGMNPIKPVLIIFLLMTPGVRIAAQTADPVACPAPLKRYQ